MPLCSSRTNGCCSAWLSVMMAGSKSFGRTVGGSPDSGAPDVGPPPILVERRLLERHGTRGVPAAAAGSTFGAPKESAVPMLQWNGPYLGGERSELWTGQTIAKWGVGRRWSSETLGLRGSTRSAPAVAKSKT